MSHNDAALAVPPGLAPAMSHNAADDVMNHTDPNEAMSPVPREECGPGAMKAAPKAPQQVPVSPPVKAVQKAPPVKAAPKAPQQVPASPPVKAAPETVMQPSPGVKAVPEAKVPPAVVPGMSYPRPLSKRSPYEVDVVVQTRIPQKAPPGM